MTKEERIEMIEKAVEDIDTTHDNQDCIFRMCIDGLLIFYEGDADNITRRIAKEIHSSAKTLLLSVILGKPMGEQS